MISMGRQGSVGCSDFGLRIIYCVTYKKVHVVYLVLLKILLYSILFILSDFALIIGLIPSNQRLVLILQTHPQTGWLGRPVRTS